MIVGVHPNSVRCKRPPIQRPKLSSSFVGVMLRFACRSSFSLLGLRKMDQQRSVVLICQARAAFKCFVANSYKPHAEQ